MNWLSARKVTHIEGSDISAIDGGVERARTCLYDDVVTRDARLDQLKFLLSKHKVTGKFAAVATASRICVRCVNGGKREEFVADKHNSSFKCPSLVDVSCLLRQG